MLHARSPLPKPIMTPRFGRYQAAPPGFQRHDEVQIPTRTKIAGTARKWHCATQPIAKASSRARGQKTPSCFTLWLCQNSFRKSPFSMGKSTINGHFPWLCLFTRGYFLGRRYEWRCVFFIQNFEMFMKLRFVG